MSNNSFSRCIKFLNYYLNATANRMDDYVATIEFYDILEKFEKSVIGAFSDHEMTYLTKDISKFNRTPAWFINFDEPP